MCISPITLRNRQYQENDKTPHTRQVPCGKCHVCLKRRQNGWAFRLYHEMMSSKSACFMTLTYGINEKDNFGENPPLSFNGIYTLDKNDLTLFIKRLRTKNKSKIKYYAVGEYGTNNKRPHYHLIVFNLDRSIMVNSLDVSKNIWKKGNVDIAGCSIKSINYVAGYIMNGTWSPETDDDDRLPQFAVMSKKLGSSYLTDEKLEQHYDRMELYVNHPAGYKIPMPRYYRDQIFTIEEKAEIYELNQKVNEMSWEEFVNIDYKRQIIDINDGIRKHLLNKKVTRTL